MSDELIHSVELLDGRGIPSFIFNTSNVEQLQHLLSLFPLTILGIDVPTWKQLPLDPNIQIPDDASLRLEFSLDDTSAGVLLWDMYIPAKTRWQMLDLNKKSKAINIGIRNKASGKILPIPGRQTPYMFDWSGTGGLILTLRFTHGRYGRGWEKDNAHQIIAGAQETITEYGGYITGLHAHIGLIHRELGEFDKAKQCYMEEIKGARRKDGTFAQSAMLGFNNLAVVYKKEQAFDKALVNFRFALALNPNYFQALISMAGLIPDFKEAIAYLGRAYRLQAQDPIWQEILHNMAPVYQMTPEALYDKLYEEAERADLTKPIVDDAILKRIKIV